MPKTRSSPGYDTSRNGEFVWYDVMTTDMKAAEAFYTKVVGWTARDSGMPGQAYTILSAGDVMVGGVMPLPADVKAPPHWTGYIGVDDVDTYAKRVTAAGGSIHKQADDIPGVGRFAVAADPDGAVFILFKPNGAGGPVAKTGQTGLVGWHELLAGDLEAAFTFYSGLFGWTKAEAIDMGPMGLYQTFASKFGEPAVGGMMKKPAEFKGPPSWAYYVTEDGIAAAADRVKTSGGQVVRPPHQVPGGSWIVQCTDPQGAHFALVSTQT